MAQDISGFGVRITVIGSVTFPNGFTLSSFSDDADPFDSPALTIAEHAMGLNGDLISWSNANPLPASLNIIPNSDDDLNLTTLCEANRVGLGKQTAQDTITLIAVYPDGSSARYTEGKCTSFIPANSIASAGRLKTKPFILTFENVTNSNA